MSKLRYISICSVLTAIMCIICPLSINIGPIPFSLSTLIIMIISICFEPKISVVCCLLYIGLGCIGLPIFSNFRGGIEHILSYSGGFIICYPIFSLSISKLYKNNYTILLKYLILLFSNLIIYLFGSIYFCILSKNSFWYALSVCVIPFIITDNIKIIVSIIISDKLFKILKNKYF